LNGVAEILKKNPAMTIVLQGHTDNVGSADYNQKLSGKRANFVKDYLVNRGISSGRISCEGYGFSQPVATNTTDFGRSLNRRVTIHAQKDPKNEQSHYHMRSGGNGHANH